MHGAAGAIASWVVGEVQHCQLVVSLRTGNLWLQAAKESLHTPATAHLSVCHACFLFSLAACSTSCCFREFSGSDTGSGIDGHLKGSLRVIDFPSRAEVCPLRGLGSSFASTRHLTAFSSSKAVLTLQAAPRRHSHLYTCCMEEHQEQRRSGYCLPYM